MINGHVYDADVKTDGSSAEWSLEQKSETTPGGDQPVSEGDLSSTFFYIKRSDGKYFAKDSTWKDNIEDAAQWQTVQQNGESTYKLRLEGSSDTSKSYIADLYGNVWIDTKGSATDYSFDGEFYYTTRNFFGGTTDTPSALPLCRLRARRRTIPSSPSRVNPKARPM